MRHPTGHFLKGHLLRRFSAFALACSMVWSAPNAYALRQTGVQESPKERKKLTGALTEDNKGNQGSFAGGIYRPRAQRAVLSGLEEALTSVLRVDLQRVSQVPMTLLMQEASLEFSKPLRPRELIVSTDAGVVSREYQRITIGEDGDRALRYSVQVIAPWDPSRIAAEEFVRRNQPAVVPAPPGSPPPGPDFRSPFMYNVLHGRGYLYVQVRDAQNPQQIDRVYQFELKPGSGGVIPMPPPDKRIVLIAFNPYTDQPLVIESLARTIPPPGGDDTIPPPGTEPGFDRADELPRILVVADLPVIDVIPGGAGGGEGSGGGSGAGAGAANQTPSIVPPAREEPVQLEPRLELPEITAADPIPFALFGLPQDQPLFPLIDQPLLVTPVFGQPPFNTNIPSRPFEQIFTPVNRPLFPPFFIPVNPGVAPPDVTLQQPGIEPPFNVTLPAGPLSGPDLIEAAQTLSQQGIQLLTVSLGDNRPPSSVRADQPELIRNLIDRAVDFPDATGFFRLETGRQPAEIRVVPIPFSEGPVFGSNLVPLEAAPGRILAFLNAGFDRVEFVLPDQTVRFDVAQPLTPTDIRPVVARVAALNREILPAVRIERAEGKVLRVTAVPVFTNRPIPLADGLEAVLALRFSGLVNTIFALPGSERRIDLRTAGRDVIRIEFERFAQALGTVIVPTVQLEILDNGRELRVLPVPFDEPFFPAGILPIEQALRFLSDKPEGILQLAVTLPDGARQIDLAPLTVPDLTAVLQKLTSTRDVLPGAVRFERTGQPGQVRVVPIPVFDQVSPLFGIVSPDVVIDRVLALRAEGRINEVVFTEPLTNRSVAVPVIEELPLAAALEELRPDAPVALANPLLFSTGARPNQLLVTPLPAIVEELLAPRVVRAEDAPARIIALTELPPRFDVIAFATPVGLEEVPVADLTGQPNLPKLQARIAQVAVASRLPYTGFVRVVKDAAAGQFRVEPVTGGLESVPVTAAPKPADVELSLGEGRRLAPARLIFRPENAGLALLVPKGKEKDIRIIVSTGQQAQYLLSQRPSLSGSFVPLNEFASVDSAVLNIKTQPGWSEASDVRDILPRDYEALRRQIEIWLAPFDWEMPDLRAGVLEAILFGSQV